MCNWRKHVGFDCTVIVGKYRVQFAGLATNSDLGALVVIPDCMIHTGFVARLDA
jgi:hypothetical protein